MTETNNQPSQISDFGRSALYVGHSFIPSSLFLSPPDFIHLADVSPEMCYLFLKKCRADIARALG